MENGILKKKLSTFRTPKGSLTRVSDDILVEVLQAWEQWPGTSSDMAKELGLTMRQLVILVEKAKKLIRNGGFALSEFKEIKIDSSSGQIQEAGPCSGVELIWNNGRIIRFSQVDLLLDFLKKAA
jgi:hypothetical protein